MAALDSVTQACKHKPETGVIARVGNNPKLSTLDWSVEPGDLTRQSTGHWFYINSLEVDRVYGYMLDGSIATAQMQWEDNLTMFVVWEPADKVKPHFQGVELHLQVLEDVTKPRRFLTDDNKWSGSVYDAHVFRRLEDIPKMHSNAHKISPELCAEIERRKLRVATRVKGLIKYQLQLDVEDWVIADKFEDDGLTIEAAIMREEIPGGLSASQVEAIQKNAGGR